MVATTRFDAAEYLDTAKRRAAYITVALESGDADTVRDALFMAARARGMAQEARRRLTCYLRSLPKPTGRFRRGNEP